MKVLLNVTTSHQQICALGPSLTGTQYIGQLFRGGGVAAAALRASPKLPNEIVTRVCRFSYHIF